MIDPRQDDLGGSIAVVGLKGGSPIGDPVELTIEDKWAPELVITKLSFNNNFAPALNTEPLEYQDNSVVVSGQVDLKQMVNIEGKVSDIGGEIATLR